MQCAIVLALRMTLDPISSRARPFHKCTPLTTAENRVGLRSPHRNSSGQHTQQIVFIAERFNSCAATFGRMRHNIEQGSRRDPTNPANST
jgi:hypothetical protein